MVFNTDYSRAIILLGQVKTIKTKLGKSQKCILTYPTKYPIKRRTGIDYYFFFSNDLFVLIPVLIKYNKLVARVTLYLLINSNAKTKRVEI